MTSTVGDAGARISEWIARQRPGLSLTREFYAEPEIFQRDIDRLLMRHWLCAGHEGSAAEPGDYFLLEIAAESVIIVRGQDRRLRALVNVCRHRGSRICSAPSGKAKTFVCPYHAWVYGLDGALRAARHMPDSFDSSAHGLKQIALKTIEGLVFVSFAEQPLDLCHVEKTLHAAFAPYDWSTARVAHRELYLIKANWKLAVENYLECYHCAPSHREYAKLHALELPGESIEKLNAQLRSRTSGQGIDIPEYSHWVSSQEAKESVFSFRYALYDGVDTGSPDGKPVAPLMGRFCRHDGGVTSVHLGPASFCIAYADHGVIYRFIPKTVDTCAMEVIWLVRGDARAGVDYDLDRLTWLWKVTSEADKRIVEDNQLGVNSRYYEPGPYAPMEENARRYIAWYLGEIA